MGEVSQCRAAGEDGLGEHFLDDLSQSGIPLPRNPASGTARGDTGTEKGLHGVDITHADYYGLIHQKSLYAGGSFSAALEEVIPSEIWGEWFRTQVLEEGVGLPLWLPEQAAKAAGVSKANGLA